MYQQDPNSSQPTPNSSSSSLTLSGVVSDLKEKLKGEDEEVFSPFQGLDKATVLHDTKMFSDANVVTRHPRKCCQLITKLLHILTQGEPFTSTETTDVFFGVTKLFQSKDSNLRRMMYLFIKEVAEATAADEVIIVTQSLTKDMNSDVDLYRANAIRVLARIVDTSMLQAIERYIKQAIVDRNSLVASSALVSGIHLYNNSSEVVKRWGSEIQEALNSPHDMVQYHALSLLYTIRQHDKLAINKLVSQLQKMSLRSPLSICLLVRYMANLMASEATGDNSQSAIYNSCYNYLEKLLRHQNEMVIYEAARAICYLVPNIDSGKLSPAITVFQLFLTSPKPVLRFTAVKTLAHVAQYQPMIVARCNEEMENLINDSNRSVATLAITTLLKTGAESSIDRLMKTISNFMSEISEEYKIVVIEAIEKLCLKYPGKTRVLLNFLANFLREEGGFAFKNTITNVILSLMERLPLECKELGLLHLCEFIEDCEFTSLSVRILHVLAQQGPRTQSPSRYIRFIYNRIILENATVRCSAISALTQFALRVPALKSSITTLLRTTCLHDEDDEVRDRAVLYLACIGNQNNLLGKDLPYSAATFYQSLEQYQCRPQDGASNILQQLPHVEEVKKKSGIKKQSNQEGNANQKKNNIAASSATTTVHDSAKKLYQIPEFSDLGSLFRSSEPIELTEAETEYVIKCIKHIFPQHVVLEFLVCNTVPDQLLRNVSVNFAMEQSDDGCWSVETELPIDELRYGETLSSYVCLAHNDVFHLVSFADVELKFEVFELDPSTNEPDEEGFEEEYAIESFDMGGGDFMAKVLVQDFRQEWDNMTDAHEKREQYVLSYKNLSDGAASVISSLGLSACNNTDSVNTNEKNHVMCLSGTALGNHPVVVKCRLSQGSSQAPDGLLLQLAVRSPSENISTTIIDSIR